LPGLEQPVVFGGEGVLGFPGCIVVGHVYSVTDPGAKSSENLRFAKI
jgi:hypothetical protein